MRRAVASNSASVATAYVGECGRQSGRAPILLEDFGQMGDAQKREGEAGGEKRIHEARR